MELRHLRYFVAVAETGHFRRAAEYLRIAQPALSRQVKALEQELGVSLFERLPRGVRLTEPGRCLLEDFKRVLDDVETAVTRVKRVALGQVGTLRLALTEPCSGHMLVMEAIRSFRLANPDVELLLYHMTSLEQLEALRRGRLEAGFLFRSPELSSDFDGLRIDSTGLLLAFPEDHAFASRAKVGIRDLLDQPLICVARHINPFFHDKLMASFAAGGIAPRIIQEANSGLILNLVLAGMGLGLVSSAMDGRLPPGIVAKPIKGLEVTSSIDLVWPHGRASPLLNQFVHNTDNLVGRHRPKRC